MIDIVERLRDAHPYSPQYAVGSMILSDAADEIETLRQRVKELEQQNEMLVNRMSHITCVNGALRADSDELATLKQSQEPVAWAETSEYGDVVQLGFNESTRFYTPLCFCIAAPKPGKPA